mmetsp:Transcript_5284/g.6470  ORF Transcript_5284/g.6470 Transcript_5284/m.6470 type:complete len:309 (+) Transcript_5284:1124-2050(+)
MLVFGVLRNVRLHHAASRPGNVPRVNNVEDHIGTIQNLVEFPPDAFGLTLLEDFGLDLRAVIYPEAGGCGDLGIASPGDYSFRGVDFVVEIGGVLGGGKEGGVRRRAGIEILVFIIVVLTVDEGLHRLGLTTLLAFLQSGFFSRFSHFAASDHHLIQLHLLPSALPPESVLERFVAQQPLLPRFPTQLLHLRRIPQQSHRQRFPFQHHRVRITDRVGHFIPKRIQFSATHDPCIPEPSSIGLDSTRGICDLGITSSIAHHELSTDDGPLLVADGFPVLVHFETVDRVLIAVKFGGSGGVGADRFRGGC